MIFLLVGGGSVWVRRCRHVQYVQKGKEMECLNSRQRVIATFLVANVCGYFYDNEDVTTYGFATDADKR